MADFNTKQKRHHMLLMRDWLQDRFRLTHSTVVGFDLSFTNTGFAVVQTGADGATLDLLAHGHFGTESKDNLTTQQRVDVLYQGCRSLLEQHNPQTVAYESVNVFKNVQAARKIIMAEAMLFKALADYESENGYIHLLPCSIGQLKKVAGVSGDKNQVLLGLYKKFGVDIQNDNEADAYCAARLGAMLPLFVERLIAVTDGIVADEPDAEANKILLDFEKRPEVRTVLDEDMWEIFCSMFGSQTMVDANSPQDAKEFKRLVKGK